MGVAVRLEHAVPGSAQPSIPRRQEGTMMTSDHSGLLVGVVFACVILVTMTMAARLLVRKIMPHHCFYLDDGLVLMASLSTLALVTVSLEGTKYGLGQHTWTLDNADARVEDVVMLMWIGQILYSFAISLAKFSIISTYLRIFPNKRLHQACWGVLGVTTAFLLGSVVAAVFICRPVQAAWDPTLRKPMSCYHFVDLVYASGVVNVVTDVILCILPLPYFLTLKIPLKQKTTASLLFIIGGLAAIASIARLLCAERIESDGSDITYTITGTLIWSVLECSISIITISIPPMRPLFAKVAPGIFNTAHNADDHKSLVDRITDHVGSPGGLMRRISRQSSWSSRTSTQRPDVRTQLTTTSTYTMDSAEAAWAPWGRDNSRGNDC